jgi:ATP-dependent DNA ligase
LWQQHDAEFRSPPLSGHDASVFLYAFDLIELNGDDLRRDPLEVRKATLAAVLASAGHGIWFNEHRGRRPDRIQARLQARP